MDDRLRRRVLQVAKRLALEEKERLAAQGTFADIEDLTAEIGDELTRQLARVELTRRADEMTKAEMHACPDCGKEAPVEPDPEPVILQGLRGEIEYSEPLCDCTRCRVSFFPSGRRVEASASGTGGKVPEEDDSRLDAEGQTGFAWTPRLLSREVIASTEGSDIARHLEWVAWEHGITSAARQAFVADGAASIWRIHKTYFGRMIPILDLMHALSYAHRAAAAIEEEGLYRRWATAIWQGRAAMCWPN